MGIIAVAGRKGGIGKSTLARNLAAGFAAMGRVCWCSMRIHNTAWWHGPCCRAGPRRSIYLPSRSPWRGPFARVRSAGRKSRIRLVPSGVLLTTNLGRSLASSLAAMGRKVLPHIGQRVVVAEAVASGLTVAEYAPNSPAHEEFRVLAKAVEKALNALSRVLISRQSLSD